MSRAKGYVVLAAAVVMQTCLGGIYAWSVFVDPLRTGFGFSAFQTQAVFGTCVLTFTVSIVFVGPLQDRFGPRPLATASGLLLAAGYLVAGLGGSHFGPLWLGAGLISGLAIGCGYVCPIATAVKWFPHHKGLVAGVAVAGYGVAAILLVEIARALFARGWDVLAVFRAVGLVYGATVVIAGLLLFLPPAAEAAASEPRPPFRRRAVLADRRFWWMFAAFFCSAFAGQTVIGQIKPIGQWLGHAAGAATLAISALAVGNAAGRIAWGFLYDRLGGRRAVMLSLAGAAASVAILLVIGRWEVGLLAGAAVVGFCYGGNFGIFAPETARLYGAEVMGAAYPLLLLSHGISAQVGPALAGGLFDRWASYAPGLAVAIALPAAALAVFAWRARAAGPGNEPDACQS